MHFTNRKAVNRFLKLFMTYALLSIIAVIMITPFLWMLITSFKPNEEMFQYPPSFIPSQITFQHYIDAWHAAPWGRYLYNTLLVAVCLTVSQVFLAALAGYTFARMRFPGQNILFILLLASMMIPFEVTLIPLFLIIVNFPFAGGNGLWGADGGTGLLNTYSALIVPRLISVFGIFLMRQFFMTLPKSLEDAARIDGCGEFKIFAKIMFPLVLPATITLSVLTFTNAWEDFFWPLIVINDQKMMPLQLGLQSFHTSQYATDWGPLMAATVGVTIPVIILFLFAQKHFMNLDLHAAEK